MDDTFLKFNGRDDFELFLEHINCQHRSIKFTLETENNGRTVEAFVISSLFRKHTFSGLYMKFDSFIPPHYKHNLVEGLLNRAWNYFFSFENFTNEVETIKHLLRQNGFPIKI